MDKAYFGLAGRVILLCVLAGAFFFGCGNSSSNNSADAPSNPNRIAWEKIPAEYNPKMETDHIDIRGVERIKMDLFGFDKDVSVSYSDALDAHMAILNRYTVFKDSASFGELKISNEGNDISVNNYGSYACSIHTENGAITSLKGGCYIRVELVLPTGAQIEVYNIKALISARFIPVANLELLQNLKDAISIDDKLKAVDDYLASYQQTGKTPSLISQELGAVIHEFVFKDGQFSALTKLQSFVSDRENLSDMIDREFSYFDRDEARRIVGLPPK